MWNLDDEIRPELSPTEQLLGVGRPPLGLRLCINDLALIPFSLVWCTLQTEEYSMKA